MFKRNLKIRQYQVIQKSHTDLVLRIVKSDDSCDISAERQRVEDDLQYYSVEVEYVDDIRVSKSGKFRTMILLDGAPTS